VTPLLWRRLRPHLMLLACGRSRLPGSWERGTTPWSRHPATIHLPLARAGTPEAVPVVSSGESSLTISSSGSDHPVPAALVTTVETVKCGTSVTLLR
jgi:hypothetical protein